MELLDLLQGVHRRRTLKVQTNVSSSGRPLLADNWLPRPGWAPDPRSPIGLVVGSCTSHPGVLGSIPKREEPGKTETHPVLSTGFLTGPSLALGGLPKKLTRLAMGELQIPRWLGSDPLSSAWWLGLAPWSFGFDSQTRGTRENSRTLC